jgi:hypothetical protein
MGHHPLFDALLMLAWLWFGLLVWWAWLKGRSVPARTPCPPAKLLRKRAKEPKPFVGLTHKPLCEACEQTAEPQPPISSSPPPLLTSTLGRRRTIDTARHFGPDGECQ